MNPPVLEDQKLREQVAELIKDDWANTRVWEAWQYGTMTQDDFVPLSETERVDEIIALIHQRENALISEVERKLPESTYDKYKPCPYCKNPYQYSCACDSAFDIAIDKVKQILAGMRKPV